MEEISELAVTEAIGDYDIVGSSPELGASERNDSADLVRVHMGFALEILDDEQVAAARELRSQLFGS